MLGFKSSTTLRLDTEYKYITIHGQQLETLNIKGENYKNVSPSNVTYGYIRFNKR